MILCADNHKPIKYELKGNLWIKSDLFFEELIPCIYQALRKLDIGVNILKFNFTILKL